VNLRFLRLDYGSAAGWCRIATATVTRRSRPGGDAESLQLRAEFHRVYAVATAVHQRA